MAGVKISQLPAIVAPALTDVFPVVQSGTTYKETMTQLASLISSNIADDSVTNAKLAPMGAYTIKGNNTNATANPQDIDAGQYPATHTNDVAAPGNVGEVISSTIGTGSGVAMTDGMNVDVTSISLTAGDWDVQGSIAIQYTTGAGNTSVFGWINNVSVTAPDVGLYHGDNIAAGFGASSTQGFAVPPRRFSLAATTTIYLTAQATFSGGSAECFGNIYGRRAR